ncbi:MAG: DUF4389 domain-containing protein [Thermoleophilaceae bacterium]
MGRHPVRLLIDDDLSRSRLTVFFRLLLAIPHFVWLFLWGIVIVFAVIGNWFATLFSGRPPAGLHSFISRYVRYATHVYSFLYLAADPFPGFGGRPGTYPVDVELPPPEPQRRVVTFFRFFLALPAFFLASALGGSASFSFGSSRRGSRGGSGGGSLAAVGSILGWFVSLARARMPRGLRDAVAWGIGYRAHVAAYLLLLTDRYPNSDPVEMLEGAEAPDHPIALVVNDELRRSRLTVFFRLLLWLPHLVWLELWGIAAQLAVFANWFITLFGGTPSAEINRFVGAYLRYETHIWAYVLLAADPFPGFLGKPGSYPVDLELPPAERQNRWITGFRLILAIPSIVLSLAYGGVMVTAAIGGWFAALFTGRMPRGLRNSLVAGVRYWAQARGYVYLITDRYPYTGPTGLGSAQPQAPPPPPAAEWTAGPERPAGV